MGTLVLRTAIRGAGEDFQNQRLKKRGAAKLQQPAAAYSSQKAARGTSLWAILKSEIFTGMYRR